MDGVLKVKIMANEKGFPKRFHAVRFLVCEIKLTLRHRHDIPTDQEMIMFSTFLE